MKNTNHNNSLPEITKRKILLQRISLLLIISGTLLLIPSAAHWIRSLIVKEPIDWSNVDALWKVILGMIGSLADVFGVIFGIQGFLTKEPPVLVNVPDSATFKLDFPLIGRDDDLKWLQEIEKDSLLVGQPGSGKTFLMYKLGGHNNGLFIEGGDINQIAREYKKKRPNILFIDDAQLHTDLIKQLLHLRQKKKTDFIIIASCWPSEQVVVADALNLHQARIRKLDYLTRDQIVEVITKVLHNANKIASPELMREIVNQAAGRPGLAIMLTETCLDGGIQDVVFGDILARNITRHLIKLVGEQATTVLGWFSLGGDAGLSINTVAKELGLSILDVQLIVTKAASGLGVIQESQLGLTIYPQKLRYVLVRDTFFGTAPLPIRPFVENTSPLLLQYIGETVLGAKACGAKIPWDLLLGILQGADSGELWLHFAYSGRDETSWVLKNRPEHLISVARPALIHAPDIVIPMLLQKAIDDKRELHSTTEHPLRLIQDWVELVKRGDGEAIRRRKALLDVVRLWFESGTAPEIGYRTLGMVLSPKFDYLSEDPGSGNRITFYSGSLTLDEILAVQNLWIEVLALIFQFPPTNSNWLAIREIIETWAYPGRVRNLTNEIASTMNSMAVEMLRSILPLTSNSPGLLHWAYHLSKNAGLNIEIITNEVFEVLYPGRDFDDWRETEKQSSIEVSKLAEDWATKLPDDILQEICFIENEAQIAGTNWPRWTPYLCSEIARQVKSPTIWLKTGISLGLQADLLASFLSEGLKIHAPDWLELAYQCLQIPRLKHMVIELVLIASEIPTDLLDDVFSNLDGYSGLVKILCLRNQIPEDRILRLLKHQDFDIAGAAAEGEWMADPKNSVRESLRHHWEKVVTNDFSGEYYLNDILVTHPKLAFMWLKNILKMVKKSPEIDHLYRIDDTLRSAAVALNTEDRKSILDKLSISQIAEKLIIPLIGDNDELYKQLLNKAELKDLHLIPLYQKPNDAWANKTKLALQADYDLMDIVHATIYSSAFVFSWSGNESDMWSEWIKSFESYLIHPDSRIVEVAKLAIKYIQDKRDRALKEERHEAIYGR